MEELGLWGAGEGWSVVGRGPDVGVEEAEEPLRLLGRGEVEIDDDVVGVIDWVVDALCFDARLRACFGEAAEGVKPGVEICDGVLDVQGGHDVSRVGFVESVAG